MVTDLAVGMDFVMAADLTVLMAKDLAMMLVNGDRFGIDGGLETLSYIVIR